MLGLEEEKFAFAATLAKDFEGAQAILVISRWKEFEKLSDLVAGGLGEQRKAS